MVMNEVFMTTSYGHLETMLRAIDQKGPEIWQMATLVDDYRQ